MAAFEIHHLEGMQYVDAHLQDEAIRAEAGAFSYSIGDISIHSRLIPSFGGILRAMLTEEAIYRPVYRGTGVITLESSLGGFHVLELDGNSWILEPGTYWASEGSVRLSYHRETIMTSLWAGEGLVYLQTKVTGAGKVVVTTRGPVEMIEVVKGKKIVADGNCVIGRTEEVTFSIKRVTKNLLGGFTAGESMARVYEGTGKILLNPSPYWRYKFFNGQAVNSDYPSHSL